MVSFTGCRPVTSVVMLMVSAFTTGARSTGSSVSTSVGFGALGPWEAMFSACATRVLRPPPSAKNCSESRKEKS